MYILEKSWTLRWNFRIIVISYLSRDKYENIFKIIWQDRVLKDVRHARLL